MSRFDPQLVRVELEVYKVVMGEFSLRVLWYPCQSFHQSAIHMYQLTTDAMQPTQLTVLLNKAFLPLFVVTVQ